MKTIDLQKEQPDLLEIINLAQQETVLLLTSDGREFLVSEADDFEKEVDLLRSSKAFQQFLESRSTQKHQKRISLEEIEAEIEQELAG